MKVFIEKQNKHVHIPVCTIPQLLEQLAINPSTVLIVKNGEVILEDEVLEDKDEIQLLSVVSGG